MITAIERGVDFHMYIGFLEHQSGWLEYVNDLG